MTVPAVIPTSNRTPGIFLRVSLGVGVRSGAEITRPILLLANKTSAGTATPDTVVYDLPDEETAILLGGVGSELHRMYQKAARIAPSATIKAIVITESAGTAASGTETFTGTATAAGTCRIWVAGEYTDVPIAVGDTAAVLAAAAELAIDDQSAWPVTASVAGAVVTVTAKHKGPRGNSIGHRVEILDAVGISVAVTGSGYLASGATSDSPATAITTMGGARYPYIASGYDDATNLDLLKVFVEAQDEAEVGRRDVVIAAFVGSHANGITLATGRNNARVRIAQHVGCESPTSEIAAAMAGLWCREEALTPACNLDGYEVTGIAPSPRTADHPSSGNKINAINAGITLLVPGAGGTLRVLRSVTTKTLDASGQPDYRVLDTSKQAVPDYIADDLEVFLADRFPNAIIGDDPAEGAPVPAGVVTPSVARDAIYGRIKTFEVSNPTAELRLIERVDQYLDQLVVERAATPAGRFNAAIPLDVVEGLHQITGDVRQVG